MKPHQTPPPGPPVAETPPASLAGVRVKRSSDGPEPGGKPGDLTQELSLPVAPELAPPPAAAEPPPAPAAPAAAEGAAPTQAPAPAPRLLDEEEVRRLLDPPGRRPAQAPAAPEPRLTVDPNERDAAVPPAPPELRLVADGPGSAKPPEAKAPRERDPGAAAPAPSSIDEIIDYWDGLRGGRPVPPLDALDRGKVAGSWPNCLLVAFGAADTVTPKLTRLGEENGDIEYSEMVIHWILSRGRLAVRKGEPMEEEKRFPVTGGGSARYQLLLLPLATPEGRSEHVLCHLTRIREVTKGGFKRWLAS